MNMPCRIRLPDHDFAVGNRHLLCPSVVAVNKIDGSGNDVGYSGEVKHTLASEVRNITIPVPSLITKIYNVLLSYFLKH